MCRIFKMILKIWLRIYAKRYKERVRGSVNFDIDVTGIRVCNIVCTLIGIGKIRVGGTVIYEVGWGDWDIQVEKTGYRIREFRKPCQWYGFLICFIFFIWGI